MNNLFHWILQAASPSAGQFTALGIYLLTCLFVVVVAMIEFAVLLNMRRICEHKVLFQIVSSEKDQSHQSNSRKLCNMNNGANISENLLNLDQPIFPIVDEIIQKQRRDFIHISHKIDYIALLMFSLLFFIFNCVYWVYYLFF